MIAPLATLPVPGLRNSRAGLFGATTLALTGTPVAFGAGARPVMVGGVVSRSPVVKVQV